MEWTVPFRPRPSAVVTDIGAFISDGLSPSILDYDLEGRLRRILRLDIPPRPVTADVVSRMVEVKMAELPTSLRGEWERTYARIPLPEDLPTFGSLQIDEDGWLWAELYSWDPVCLTEWVIFDREGRARGTVKTPRGLTIGWIGEDHLFGVFTDELGLEYVHRYGLRKGSPSEPRSEE